METSFRGTFVISWSQTQTDGETAATPTTLAAGKTWRWEGDVVRIDGPGALLRLDEANGESELRRRAALRVRKLVGAARTNTTDIEAVQIDLRADLDEDCFVVTDGCRAYTVTVIAVDGAHPLAMFVDQVPPRASDLWLVAANMGRTIALKDKPARAELGQMICFTPGTQVRVADGSCDVAELAPGDWVQTMDNGMQQVIWTGAQRISGARLHISPELLPVRIRAGALGDDRPDAELLVSPEHRMLARGRAALDLFNTDEVLVSARNLINGSTVWIDRLVREVTYVHVLFEHHEIVFANGLETESFHPAQAALSDQHSKEVAAALPSGSQPDFARRVLSKSEAAIMGFAA